MIQESGCFPRHSRAGGNPGKSHSLDMDSRLPGCVAIKKTPTHVAQEFHFPIPPLRGARGVFSLFSMPYTPPTPISAKL